MEGRLHSLVDWLVGGAPDADELPAVLGELCERLRAAGVPLYRAAILARTLHPNVMGVRVMWQEREGARLFTAPFAILESDDWTRSPVPYIARTGTYVHRRLGAPDCPVDFKILEELRTENVTDYLAMPLTFVSGERHVVSWTTRARDGFTLEHLAAFGAVEAPLARIVEIHLQRRVATTLLDTYVGHRTGARILSGQIRLGHTEPIEAAIWLADLRGFTHLADTTRGPAVIDLLNDYFACMVPPIEAHGGEVLKFMGDGLLAIFPLEREQMPARVCTAVLVAARDARANVAAMNERLRVAGRPAVRFGLALHVGELLYGNIGAANRLDFTAIGPGVNLSARLEKVAGEIGRDVVVSAEFARHCPEGLQHLGEFELRGFQSSQTVYGLPEMPSLE
jgi:adenylate cyclase